MQFLSRRIRGPLGGNYPFGRFQYLSPLRASGCSIYLQGLKSTISEVNTGNLENRKKIAPLWKKENTRLHSLCEQSYSKGQYCQLMDNKVNSSTSLTEPLPKSKYKEILVTKHGGLLTITLNRPLEHNAINYQMYTEWQQALTEAGDDSDVVVAMITGAGDYYCSGNDLSNFMNIKQAVDIAMIQREFVSSFIQFPKPLLAAINGPAIGISVMVLGLCDLVYASDKATFQTHLMTLCQNPEDYSSIFSMMGTAKAHKLSRRLTAQEAYKMNLVMDVFPQDMFRKEVHDIASSMAKQDLPELQTKSKMLRRKQR